VYRGPRAIEQPNDEMALESLARTLAPGTYQIQAVSSLEGTEPSQFNDTWLKVFYEIDPEDYFDASIFAQKPGGEEIYAQGNEEDLKPVTPGKNDSKDGWMKFYINHDGIGKWGTQTSAIDNDPTPIFIESVNDVARFIIALKGRDTGHAIAAIFLRRTDLAPSVIDPYVSEIVLGNGPMPDPTPDPGPGEPDETMDSIIIERNGGKFEAVLVNIDASEVEKVDFTLDGGQPHTERVWRYEYSPKTIPQNSFKIVAALTYKDGRPQLIGNKVFETVGTPLPPETGGGGVVTPPPPLPDASIELFDTFVSEATGIYYRSEERRVGKECPM
jgi:hypothetical protein